MSCYSMDGEADGAIALYSVGMAWIFSEVEDTTGRRLNCVGEGGVFAVQAGAIQIGFSASTTNGHGRNLYRVNTSAPGCDGSMSALSA